MRFIGRGQLPPEGLRLLRNEREPVSTQSVPARRSVWARLRSLNPKPLAAVAAAWISGLPQFARAALRHCQELRWTGDRLSLTQRLILQLLAEGPRTANQTFHRLMMEREPLPWLSELMFRFIVESMRHVDRPVFTGTIPAGGRSWPEESLSMTYLGRAFPCVISGQGESALAAAGACNIISPVWRLVEMSHPKSKCA